MVKYYARRPSAGKPDLLFRMGTTLPEYLAEGGEWTPDASLVRHFVDDDIEEVEEGDARRLAEAMGGSL